MNIKVIYVEESQWEEFKKKTETEGKKMSGLIRVWIREYLKEE